MLFFSLYLIFSYSRKILWLKVAATNNDPCVIGRYFIDTVLQSVGTNI